MSSEPANLILRQYRTDGTITECNERWNLKQMQSFVGGYIEMVPTANPQTALIINETGTLDGLPENLNATAVLRDDVRVLDYIRGNALLILREEEEV